MPFYLQNLINFKFVDINLIQQKDHNSNQYVPYTTKKKKKTVLNQIFLPAGKNIGKNLKEN